MELLEHNCDNISPTVCSNMVIFSKDTFLDLISRLIISTSAISYFIFVTSHLTALLLA